MKKIEIIDVTFKTELDNFVYESNIIPKKNELLSINSNTYVVIDIIHNINSNTDITLLTQPVFIKYGKHLH